MLVSSIELLPEGVSDFVALVKAPIFAALLNMLGKSTRSSRLLETDIIVGRIAIHDMHARNDVFFLKTLATKTCGFFDSKNYLIECSLSYHSIQKDDYFFTRILYFNNLKDSYFLLASDLAPSLRKCRNLRSCRSSLHSYA